MYGKIVNGELIEAPQDLTLEDGNIIKNFNRSITKMLSMGFKPVIDTKPSYNVNKQYCKFESYLDTGKYIYFKWTVEDIEIPEVEVQNQETKKAMELLNINFQEQIQTLTDEQALEVPLVFPAWSVNVDYKKDFKLRYNDILYKVLQDHTSQGTWTPDVSVSLFAKVLVGGINPDTGEQEILEWKQPNSTNAYMKGDKVLFKGTIYESSIDNNVWSPSDYPAGWKIIN